MDPRDYISTGKLELYVLGKLDREEERGVEQIASEQPAVKAEIESIELALEKYALLHSVPPPPGVLDQVLEKIRSEPSPTRSAESPPPATGSGSSFSFLTPLLAVLTAAASIAAFLFWNQQQTAEEQLQNLQTQYADLTESCAEQEEIMDLMAEQIDFLRSPSSRQIILNSANETLAPNALAAVFYNPEIRQSYFTPAALPEAPQGRQYQLWAIVDGAPVDMGVLTFTGGSTDLIEVPFIENPGAFAITLEPEGGSELPTLDQLYVIGNVS